MTETAAAGMPLLALWRRALAGMIDLLLAAALTVSVYLLWGDTAIPPLGFYAVVAGVHFAYSAALLQLADGRTVGLAIVKGMVVGEFNARLRPAQVLSRCVAFWLGFAMLGLGWATAWARADHRAIHDMASFSRVVRASASGDAA